MMKTLIMIPAFGCDGRLYEVVSEVLEDIIRIQIITPTADRYSGMVEEVLEQAPNTFAVLGTSMGGRVALEVALAAPNRVRGLVIIGAGAGPTVDPAAGLRRSARIRNGEMSVVLQEMGDMVSHLAGPLGANARDAFIKMGRDVGHAALARQSDALARRIDLWDSLPKIACPTLCLWGVHDKFSPPEDGKRIAASVQNGKYMELNNCGHFPTLEYPDETALILKNWFVEQVISNW